MAKVAMDLQRVRDVMREHNLDGFLFTDEDNIFWASGKLPKPGPEGDKPCYLVIPADPTVEPGMIMDKYFAIMMKVRGSPITDIRIYHAWQEIQTLEDVRNGVVKKVSKPAQHDHNVSQRLLSELFKDKGLQNSTIGTERGFLMPVPYPVYCMIEKNNPSITFVDAERIFWALRSIKTEDEIKAHKASAALALKGLRGMISGEVIGKTLQELQHRFRDTVLRELTDSQLMEMEWRHQTISAGPPIASRFATEYKIKEGDTVYWDGGLKLNSYNSDFCRVFSAGETGELERKFYYAMKAGQEAGLEQLRPGRKLSDIWKAMHEAVWKYGLPWFYRGNCGHSLGFGRVGEQPPFVAEDEEAVLQSNMVICVECPLFIQGLGAFAMEDECLITPDGYELLTPVTRELVELY